MPSTSGLSSNNKRVRRGKACINRGKQQGEKQTHLDAVDEVVFSDTIHVLQSISRGHGPAGPSRDEVDLCQRDAETVRDNDKHTQQQEKNNGSRWVS